MNIIESTIDTTLYGRMNGDIAELLTRDQIAADEKLDIADFLVITAEPAHAIGASHIFVCLVSIKGVLIPALGTSAEIALRSAVTMRAVGASISPAQQEFLAITSAAATQKH